jgi:protoporphyrinogen oxidase
MKHSSKLNRRNLIKLSTFSLSGFLIENSLNSSIAGAAQNIIAKLNPQALKPTSNTNNPLLNDLKSPITNIQMQDLYSTDFNGDEINKSHEILWNIDGFIKSKGGLPKPTESCNLVIVGGGISGLLSAYYLQDQSPIILDSAKQFGGNAKGEIINDVKYSIGTAYISKPEEGSATETLLKDLDLLNDIREEMSEEAQVFMQNRFLKEFWQGESDKQVKQQFIQIYSDLKTILENNYPDITDNEDVENLKRITELDSLSFEEWMTKQWGTVHPHIREYFQLYCWSSFGGSIDELSAAQALNFLAAETDTICAFPGGNGAITEALFKQLSVKLGSHSLRSQAIVIDIREQNDDVLVTYVDANENLQAIKTKKCIVASPKMIASRIIPEMPIQQKKACEEITYRAYIVANVLVAKPFTSPCFDLYCLNTEVPESPTAMNPPKRAFTDICFGSWAQEDKTDYSVLTIYKPLPYQGARQFLFADYAHDKHKKIIMESLENFLPYFNTSIDKVQGVRLTRWGHALPLANKGMLNSGVLEQARAPINSKIFFANQDNWANPCFETALASVLEVKKLLDNAL